jgi:hypothetical protein
MEKKKPHYPLREIQQMVEMRKANAFTATALMGAAELGLSPDEAVSVASAFRQTDFLQKHDHARGSSDLAGRISR